MEDAYIQSRHNEQIKNLVKLRERKYRDRQERFLVEGLRELSHALQAGYAIETIYYCPEHFPTEAHSEFIRTRRASEQPALVRLSPEAFDKATQREGPDGIIAVGHQQSHALEALQLPDNPLLLILEGIEKPGNLGAILRSADGAGADAVILVDCVLDPYNPNAIRSSQGLLFALPLVTAERDALAQWLTKHQIQTCATTPAASTLHWDCDFTQASALILGSEHSGLSDYWIQSAAQTILIPMTGQADSLNVAATAAVCLYEARRQRQPAANN